MEELHGDKWKMACSWFHVKFGTCVCSVLLVPGVCPALPSVFCLLVHSTVVITDIISLSLKKTRKGMKLKYLSLEDKLKVLERVDSGATMQMVCVEFGVKPSTFYDIKKNRDKIRQQLLVDNGSSKVKRTCMHCEVY